MELRLARLGHTRHPAFLSVIASIVVLATSPTAAPAQWRLDAWFGDALNARTPVTFSQAGQPDIKTEADWSTRPWEPTWYYAGRISKWSGDQAWAFEYMHHKLYLDNPPADVRYFRITNGINNLLAEHLWRTHGWEYGVAAGPAFVVPTSEVRGQGYDHADGIFESRYEFGGGTVELTLGRRLKVLPFLFGSFAVKGTASYLDVNIADGKARLVNLALHLEYGIALQAPGSR
jgi:hypothetical protein